MPKEVLILWAQNKRVQIICSKGEVHNGEKR